MVDLKQPPYQGYVNNTVSSTTSGYTDSAFLTWSAVTDMPKWIAADGHKTNGEDLANLDAFQRLDIHTDSAF